MITNSQLETIAAAGAGAMALDALMESRTRKGARALLPLMAGAGVLAGFTLGVRERRPDSTLQRVQPTGLFSTGGSFWSSGIGQTLGNAINTGIEAGVNLGIGELADAIGGDDDSPTTVVERIIVPQSEPAPAPAAQPVAEVESVDYLPWVIGGASAIAILTLGIILVKR